MEQKAQQRLTELMNIREREDHGRQMRSEQEQARKDEDLKDRIVEENWKLEDEERRLKGELELRERTKMLQTQ